MNFKIIKETTSHIDWLAFNKNANNINITQIWGFLFHSGLFFRFAAHYKDSGSL